ncbi:family 78 glycoside hydrolase catalytic domain [Draconibacterium sp. IB214405]|uniref:family 78 glycoside hydrolase catalytic domain n=1 Tax=Draconibacterium sp. IB214405 TaxID=3097352 RepID=UPI002A0D70D9|nr:family 78 glycoside hydrolase catalytic domain [Draconibacterium sp. IB214405]MDX8339349.1 family 78 glycoside hydrolase catalytic domain [Draconibacterium sp. IB214405]
MKNRILKPVIFCLFAALIFSFNATQAETEIYDLTVNYAENPVGIERSGIKFGWKMKSDQIGQGQKDYRIEVEDLQGNKVWDSGMVDSDISVAIPYEGPQLKLETRYTWKLSVTCTNGESLESLPAYFETGTEFSSADWIYYKPQVENCFKNSMEIKVKPTILVGGFTLYFGIKNSKNRFAWTFTEKELNAVKENSAGNVELAKTGLGDLIQKGISFELSILVTDHLIITSVNKKEINRIEHNYAIERPFLGLFVNEARMDFRSRQLQGESESAVFENLTLSVDDKTEQIRESSLELTAPTPDPTAGFSFGPGGPSGVSFFQETFNGKPVEYQKEATKMPMFRTEQDIKGKVESARLYISSLGIFDAYVNGEKVKKTSKNGEELIDIFSPGWTNYNDYIYYRSYDVTPIVKGNKVTIAARIGDGWYAGLIGREYYHEIGEAGINELALIAKLVINYGDGSQQVIRTNTSDWTASDDGPVLQNDFFIGEIYDARLEKNIKGWNNVGFDDSKWQKVQKLDYKPILRGGDENTAYMPEELRIHPKKSKNTFMYNPEKIDFSGGLDYGSVIPEPVDPGNKIELPANKRLMIDLGQNIAGITGITVSGPDGTQIKLRGAEMLNDGKKNPNHESGAGSCGPNGTLYWTGLTRGRDDENDWYTDVYYLNDNEIQKYSPNFTFHGFRYLEISTDNDITIHSVYAQPITSVLKQTGNIVTNNENVNRLFKNTLWSQMGNHITIPTDCPNRSERLGWSGDIVVFAETALYNFDAVNFMNNYMEISANFADNNAGRLGTTMPGPSLGDEVPGGIGGGSRTNAGWTDIGIILSWALYQQTGDISVLKTNYELLSSYMNEVMKDNLRAGFGDWVALQTTSGVYMAGVYQAYDALLMSKIADAVGKSNDATRYLAEYNRMRNLLTVKYLDKEANLLSVSADNITNGGFLSTGIIQDNSQTSILWALKMGLYHSEEEKDILIKNLLTNIDNKDESIRKGQGEKTLSTGFLGVNVLLPVLTENGLISTAYDLLLQDEMPSWLYEVKQNATTTWERWNAYSHVNSFEDNGMNSFNHYAYGAVGEWLFENMAGIQKDEKNPGFKHIILQPSVDNGTKFNDQERINEVNAEYDSYYGKIKSAWSTDSGNITSYSTEIPANTQATLYLQLDGSLTEKSLANIHMVKGVNYTGIQNHNNKQVAVFDLYSGGYDFKISSEAVNITPSDNYVSQ